jgi:hypothetical protein
MKFNFDKQKIFEIILTALVSAGIAILQNLITSNIGIQTGNETPFIAGVIAAGIRSFRA